MTRPANRQRLELRKAAREAVAAVTATTPRRPASAGVHAWVTERVQAAHQELTARGLTLAGVAIHGTGHGPDTLTVHTGDSQEPATIAASWVAWPNRDMDETFAIDLDIVGVGTVPGLIGINADTYRDDELATLWQLLVNTDVPLAQLEGITRSLS